MSHRLVEEQVRSAQMQSALVEREAETHQLTQQLQYVLDGYRKRGEDLKALSEKYSEAEQRHQREVSGDAVGAPLESCGEGYCKRRTRIRRPSRGNTEQ